MKDRARTVLPLTLALLTIVGWPAQASAQTKMRRIGLLMGVLADDDVIQ